MRVFDLIDGCSKTHAAPHYHTHAHTYMYAFIHVQADEGAQATQGGWRAPRTA